MRGLPGVWTDRLPAEVAAGEFVGSADGRRRELSGEQIEEAVERAAGRRWVRQALGVASDRWIRDEVVD